MGQPKVMEMPVEQCDRIARSGVSKSPKIKRAYNYILSYDLPLLFTSLPSLTRRRVPLCGRECRRHRQIRQHIGRAEFVLSG
jgi:hypothetical protein